MPFFDISADQITAGAFSDSYIIDGSFTVGDTAGPHVVVGADSHGADGVRLYGPDGVTPVVDLRADTGAATFTGTVTINSTVPGSTVTGTVANATNAANATTAGSANTATTATNLGGGGTASGTTTIAGELIVGNPAGAHVIVGTDGNGADGVRLYAADGVTPLIDLNIAGTPTITGAIIQTAATGKRLVLSVAASDRMSLFTGDAAETSSGVVQTQVNGVAANRQANVNIQSPNLGHGSAQMVLWSGAADGTNTGYAGLFSSLGGGLIVQNDITLTPTGGGRVVVQGGDLRAGNVISTGAGAQFQFDCRDGSDNYIWYSPTTVTGARLYRVAAGNDIAGFNQQGGLSVGRIDSGGIGVAAPARLFMSSGAPPNGAGANGDFCLRYDTPGTANQRLYVKSAGAWVGII